MHAELPSAVFLFPMRHLRQPGDAGPFCRNSARGILMAQSQIDDLIAQIDAGLLQNVKTDVANHVAGLNSNGVAFYGYAIQTPTWQNVEQPIAIYNCENDIEEDNRDSTYYRYSVDEWQHYENDALPLTTAFIGPIDQMFNQLRDDLDDDNVERYLRNVYVTFAKALGELKAEGLFKDDVFLIVWNEDEELLVKFAQQLNADDVAEPFAEEFGF